MSNAEDAPKRSFIQIRPKGTKGPTYSPQRDLAYIYSPAFQEAIHGLDWDLLDETHRKLAEREGLTRGMLGAAIERFAEAHLLFTRVVTAEGEEVAIRQPVDALKATGFLDAHPLAQTFVYERLGAVLTGGFFVAVRDVTPLYDAPPPQVEMEEMLAAGRALAERMMAGPYQLSEMDKLQEELKAMEARRRREAHVANLQRAEGDAWKKQCALVEADARNSRLLAIKAEDRLQALRRRSWWARLMNRDP